VFKKTKKRKNEDTKRWKERALSPAILWKGERGAGKKKPVIAIQKELKIQQAKPKERAIDKKKKGGERERKEKTAAPGMSQGKEGQTGYGRRRRIESGGVLKKNKDGRKKGHRKIHEERQRKGRVLKENNREVGVKGGLTAPQVPSSAYRRTERRRRKKGKGKELARLTGRG